MRVETLLGAGGVYFDNQADAFIHRDSKRLRAAHAAESGGEDKFSFERWLCEMFLGERAEGFVRALQNSLRADVNPTARGHLPVHDESVAFAIIKIFLGRPMGDDVGIGEEDARRVGMRFEDADGFAGLNEKGFVVF